MHKLFTILAATMIAGAVVAEETPVLSGEVSLDFAETTTGDIGGTMDVDLGVDAPGLVSVDLDFSATDNEDLNLDNYTLGTKINGVGIAFGNDNGLMVEAEGEQTLAAPAMDESIEVTVGSAAVAVGFTDLSSDATDISNIQGSYTMGVAGLDVTTAGDYNLNTENTVLGAGVATNVGDVKLGGVVTFDNNADTVGYETTANVMDITTYLNGDNNDTLQNIGGEYERSMGSATFSIGANYNLDTEDFAPTAGISFKF